MQHVWVNYDSDLIDVGVQSRGGSTPAPITAAASAASAPSRGKQLVAASLALAAALAIGGHGGEPATTSQTATTTTETIHTTANHPWLTADRGWIAAGELRAGEQVVTLSGGSTSTVAWVHVVPGQADYYNLTVAKDHTYAVGDTQAVVHNCTRVVGDPSAIADHLDENTYFHYTNEEGYQGIMSRDDEAVLAARGGKLHVAQDIYSPAEAEQNLYIGKSAYAGKGDYVIVFQAPEGAVFERGTQPNEIISRNTVRVPMSNILYAGPNPFR